MKRNCFKKGKKFLKENICFKTFYGTKETVIFCSAKNSIPIHHKANVICKVTYPGCNEYYVGKTDRSLVTRWNEHVFREDQPMCQQLTKCEHFAHIIDSLRLPDIDVSTKDINNKQHFVKVVMAWKQRASLFYFHRAATDFYWRLVNGRFGSVTVLWD